MPQPELYRPRILIVDDVPDNLHALVNILRDEYAITAATSGAKAVEIAQRVPMPEMILLDIKMPDMDGYAVVEHLKSNPATADIPVMFVTALDDNADVKRGLDLGVVDYLIKPVDPELLRLRLRIQFQLRRAYQRQGSDMTLQRFDAGQPPSVLIVDDDPDSVDLLTVVLKDDFRIVVASNGAKALEIVQGETAPDLVLLDVMMPGMSGYEVCRRIKAMPIGIQIPVLFISAGSDVDAKIKGFDIGGSDYITKPYDVEEVRVRVRNQMELTRLRRYLENLVTQRTSQLRISEEKYRTVADFTYDWEFWVGPDGRYLYVSPSCERLTGYSADAFLDDPDLLERIVDPEDHLIIERHLSAIPHASMHTCALEFRVVTKAGETRWMEHRCRPVLRGDGTYLGRRASNRDITDRKLVVQRLREESDRSRLYLEVAEVFIVVLDEAARIQLINRKGCEILGRNESELIGRSWPEFCEPAKREQGLDNICRLMADDAGAELKSEYGVISNTGELRYFEWRRAVLHDEQGKPYGVVNSGRDVTDERHSQQLIAAHQANLEDAVRERTADLSVSEARMRAIVTTMLDSVVHIDERGTILAVNRAVGTLFGYEESEMVGCNVSMLMPASTAAAHDGYLQRYAGTREARIIGNRREVEARHKNGNLFPVELAVSQIQEDAELSFIGVIRDLTEQKNGERTLKQALQAAKDAAAAKSNFLANMSHEIRTPLNAILGLSRIGIRDSGQRKIIEVFKRLSASGNHLLAVVNDILDFSKIEAGKFTIEQRPFALFSVIDTVQNFVATRAEEKGLKLTVSQASDLSDWVVGDSLRLTQILTNLLSNAIKFTERGLVVLRIARENDDVYFMVTDTGVGMTQAQVDRLFQPFEQGDASTTRTYGGTGLGLVISKNLTEMLGGDIEVDSRVGVGSCFMLRLPLPVVNAPEHQPDRRSLVTKAGQRLGGLSVLAADDVEINRLILEDLLIQEGAHVAFAIDGVNALELLETQGAGAFDVVLMDIQMPLMDGYEATRRIKEIAPSLPVIGLTAYAMAEEREKCFAAGMVDHVIKPIDVAALVEAIQKHANWNAQAVKPRASPEQAELQSEGASPNHLCDDPEIIDLGVLARLIGQHPAKISKFALHFLETARATLLEMRAAQESGDWTRLAALGHRLRTGALTVGAIRFGELCNQLERIGTHPDPREAGGLLRQMQALFGKIEERVRHATHTPET